MTKQECAEQIADQLHTTERKLNKAAAEASKLLIQLVEAQAEFDSRDIEGEHAISQVSAAIEAVSEARKAMIAAHQSLASIKDRHGVDVAATVLPVDGTRAAAPSDAQLIAEAPRHLRVVR